MKRMIPLILIFSLLSLPSPINASTSIAIDPTHLGQAESAAGCSIPVNYLYTVDDADGSFGGVDNLLIEIDLDSRDEVRVGFFQTEVGGAGPSWQAATWSAIMLSSMLLGIDANAYRFVFDVEGYLDGSSVGALTTVGILACILGDPIHEDMSFTGNLNPDGTVGPVGGIYYKLQGAAEAGVTTVLIPQGQAVEYVEELDEEIDYVAYGQELGIEVIEVIDIISAYQLMTGFALPLPAGDDVPNLSKSTTVKLEAAYHRVKAQYQQLDERQSAELTVMQQRIHRRPLARAKVLAGLATDMVDKGQFAAAYDCLTQSIILLSTLFNQIEVEQSLESGTATPLRPIADRIFEHFSTVRGELDRQVPQSFSDAFALIDAYGLVAVGDVPFYYSATDSIDQLLAGQLDESDYDPLLKALTLADVFYQAAQDRVMIETGIEKSDRPTVRQLNALFDLLWHATEANLLFVEELEWAQDWLKMDPDYMLAKSALEEAKTLKDGSNYNDRLARLGFVSTAYLASSSLAMLTYSLEPEWNDIGVLTVLEPTESFDAILAWARIRAAETLSQAGNHAPTSAIIAFQTADGERETSDPDLQMRAVTYYWRATLQTTQFLAMSGILSDQIADLMTQTGHISPLWDAGRIRSMSQISLDDIRRQPPTVEDSFDRANTLWTLADSSESSVIRRNNELIISHQSPGYATLAESTITYPNFLMETDVRFNGYAGLSEAGVIFRDQGNSSTKIDAYYFYSIDTDGYFNLWEVTEASWNLVTYGIYSDELTPDLGTPVRIGVWTQSDRIALLIDGVVVDEISNANLQDGYLSLAALLGDEGTIEVAFDNFKLWALPISSSP